MLMKNSDYIKKYRSCFEKLKGEKILIYGTGVIAERILNALYGYDIAGVLDGLRFIGNLQGRPIIMWEEVLQSDNIDAVIIASLEKNYREIYERIKIKCNAYGITVYGADGQVIKPEGEWTVPYNDARYFQKNKQKLLDMIDNYDAVSFDLFDTLIMRKTLYPVDVFEIVEYELTKEGIYLRDFKKYRREAELKSEGRDIYCIYEILKNMVGLSDEIKMKVLEKELEVERKCLVPRKVMVDVMQYALEQGKAVNIISDMYLTADFLGGILENMGIHGYGRIYVSCEYGKGKGGGLFDVYKQTVQGMRCLHIGDNYNADVNAAKRYGIDGYWVKSAYELLMASNYRNILAWTNNYNERNMVGMMISELFNDPFVLYNTSGFVPVMSMETFAKVTAAPIAIIYMQELVKVINAGQYDGVLMTSRDCYFFKRLLPIWVNNGMLTRTPDVMYFHTSRKLAMNSTINSEDDVRHICGYINSADGVRKYLCDFIGEDKVLPYVETGDGTGCEYMLAHINQLLACSKEISQNYKRYMESKKIDCNKGKYLICDLNSRGTVQHYMNRFFTNELTGFYLYKIKSSQKNANVISVYKDGEHMHDILDYTFLLEFIFSSPNPSVASMDSDGSPVYAGEVRSQGDIGLMEIMQDGIEEFCREYVGFYYKNCMDICKELINAIIGNIKCTFFEDECIALKRMKLFDDLDGKRVEIIK